MALIYVKNHLINFKSSCNALLLVVLFFFCQCKFVEQAVFWWFEQVLEVRLNADCMKRFETMASVLDD